jgi:hypothetical protein
MEVSTANYWNSRYLNKQTGWDLGTVSPPLKAYIDQIENKNSKILIPGAGNGYEAVYLLEMGFTNVNVVDFAQEALNDLRSRLENANENHYSLVSDNFFNLDGKYDLILEQTFFCAIDPFLRANYVRQTHNLLNSNGKIAGLLFNRMFSIDGPPFGGSEIEYRRLFEPKFEIKVMETAHNSIKPRKGAELFILMSKK